MKVLRSSSEQPQVLFLINVSTDGNQIFMLDYVLASISVLLDLGHFRLDLLM